MENNNIELLKIIEIDPEKMSGRAIIRGLRFRVLDVIEMLQSGMEKDEILNQHPDLEMLDIEACILFEKNNDIFARKARTGLY